MASSPDRRLGTGFARRAARFASHGPEPDWTRVHRELRRPGVTLMLPWEEEYRACWCELYRRLGESAVANDAADALGGRADVCRLYWPDGRTGRRPARARSDGRRLCRCDGRIQLPFTPRRAGRRPFRTGSACTSARWLSWCAVPSLIDRLRAAGVVPYRACEFAAGVGGWLAIIGGLSIPYATMPMNKRIGMTIGGTKYFMVFPLLENPRQQPASLLERCRSTGQGPERNVVGGRITTCRRVVPLLGQDRRAAS